MVKSWGFPFPVAAKPEACSIFISLSDCMLWGNQLKLLLFDVKPKEAKHLNVGDKQKFKEIEKSEISPEMREV